MLLWYVIIFVLVVWLFGFIGHFGGNLIHLLVLVAVVLLVIQLVRHRED